MASPRRRRAAPGDPLVAVAYLRVSTDKQENGPAAQRAAIEAWATARKVRVVVWASDEGVSGAKELADRPGLLSATGSLVAMNAGLLVVAKRDRLARDVMVATLIERRVAAAGARVVSADGAGNEEGPSGDFMRRILDSAAEYERALIRARTKAALAVRRAQGLPSGPPPYGYRVVATGALNVRGRPATRLEEHPQEQAVIAQIIELERAGASQREIVEILERAGVRSRGDRPLAQVQVHRILTARRAAS